MRILIDLLRGFSVSILMTVLSAAAFGGHPAVTLLTGAVCLAASVFLLYSDTQKRRNLRSIAAVLGYLPAVFGLGLLGIYSFMFELLNPAYVREYGGAWAGDAFGLLLHLPVCWMLIWLSVLIAAAIAAHHEKGGQR